MTIIILSEATLDRIRRAIDMTGFESRIIAGRVERQNLRNMERHTGRIWCPQCGSDEIEYLRRDEIGEDRPEADLVGAWSCLICNYENREFRERED